MSKELSMLQYEDVRKQIGHYKKTDYHPEIRPAGTVVLAEGIEDCFKDYKLQDRVDALTSALVIRDKQKANESFHYSSKISTANPGIYTGVRSCLEMSKQTPFQSLIAELKATAMNSYWKKEVGKIPDQTPNLPHNINPVLTTFGKSTKSNLGIRFLPVNFAKDFTQATLCHIVDGTAAELVNPQKTAAEVIADSRIGHALYRKTHNDYYPSERVNREYVEPFNRKYKYGKETRIDKLGSRVKRSMKWFNQDVASIVSNLQADFKQNNEPRLGHAVVRDDVALLLEGRIFGRVSELGSYGVGELLKNSLPNTDKSIQKQYLEHINMLRLNLKKRAFSFSDLYQTFVHCDRNKTNMMTMDETYRILQTFQIYPDRKLFETLLNTLNLIKDHTVSYKDITDLLSWKCEFPLLSKIDDVPPEHRNYSSTYKETICQAHFPEGNPRYTAGLDTKRVDVPYAVVPPGGPRCERESLGDQTSVAALLSPNIFTQNGLSHLDFFKIRKAHEIRKLFEDIGVDFPRDSFNVIWNEGLKKDCTGGVCIETFRNLLDKLAAANYEEIEVS